MNTLREVAKFACGAEAFHAFFHAILWASGTTLTVFDISATPTWNIFGAVVNAIIAMALGFFAWRGLQLSAGSPDRRSMPARSSR